MKREVEKYLSAWGTNTTGEPDDAMSKQGKVVDAPQMPTEGGCTGCGGLNVVKVKMGTKHIVGCKDCHHRFTV